MSMIYFGAGVYIGFGLCFAIFEAMHTARKERPHPLHMARNAVLSTVAFPVGFAHVLKSRYGKSQGSRNGQ